MNDNIKSPVATSGIIRAIDPGIMLVQIGRYGMTHPPAAESFEYTRAVLRSLMWEASEVEEYVNAARSLGATDDKSLVTAVLHPLSQSIRCAVEQTLGELTTRK